MTIPLPLETARLVLRPFADDDLEPMLALYADPEVMRFIPGGVLDRAGAARVLAGYRRAQAERGFSFWAVTVRESGRVVGDAGFGVHAATGEPELGYSLARDAWGHGYASEAAAACIEAAFRHLGVHRVVALVDVDNAASLRVAERVGLERVATVHAHSRPHVLLERLRR